LLVNAKVAVVHVGLNEHEWFVLERDGLQVFGVAGNMDPRSALFPEIQG